MADRPILFSGPMVRALLDGRKTQTRRVLKAPADYSDLQCTGNGIWYWWAPGQVMPFKRLSNPYAPGDRLWVREAHALLPATAYRMSIGTGTIAQVEHPTDGYSAAVMREGFDRSGRPRWRPSIHMPRWASRITLTVTDVRVQRLQDISEADAQAEGVGSPDPEAARQLGIPAVIRAAVNDCACASHIDAMRETWAHLHGVGEWAKNLWVVALSFTVQRGNIDQVASCAS